MTDAITVRDIKRLAENDSTAVAARILALLNNFQDKLALVADNAALKAIGTADRADKFLAFKEDTLQLFAFDSGSAAVEALGPPPTVVAPTSGTGRWIALTLGGSAATKSYVDSQDAASIASALATLNTRLRSAADAAAVKALDVALLADKALVFVEDLRQIFAYDSASTAGDVTGVSIEPTAGAGAYLAVTAPPAAFIWTVESQAVDPAADENLPAAANGTFNNSNRLLRRIPCKGTLRVYYLGAANGPFGIDNANTAVFKIIKSDNTALITKTFDTDNQPGGAGSPTLLGTAAVVEGDIVGWECITGANANLPIFNLQFDITPTA